MASDLKDGQELTTLDGSKLKVSTMSNGKIMIGDVVSGKVMAADLKDGQMITTVQGSKLKVTIKDGKVMINGANVISADIPASNGVIHVIDKVVMPKM